MLKEMFHTKVAIHYPTMGKGWKANLGLLLPCRSSFKMCTECATYQWFHSEDSNQCSQKNDQVLSIKYQINKTKESYQSTLLQDRPDRKWGMPKHVSMELVVSPHNLHLHPWRCKWHKKQWSGLQQVYGGSKKGYTANRKKGKVPKPVSTHAWDTAVIARRLGNVSTGVANGQGWCRNHALIEKRRSNELKAKYLICTQMAWSPMTRLGGFPCKTRCNQHPWQQCCIQGQNIQLDNESENSHGY